MLPGETRDIQERVEERTVLFADMLGFARLTELKMPTLDEFARIHETRDQDGRVDVEFLRLNPTSLVSAFAAFHRAVDVAVATSRATGSIITTVAFSDSAFIVCSSLNAACGIAIALMNDLLPRAIMLRIGIASGTILTIRFRSDTTFTHGDYSAQFLGTGVVRAYAAAENSRLAGARILLHPSIYFDAGDLHDLEERARRRLLYEPLQLPEHELYNPRTSPPTNPLRIEYEINYLGRHDRRLYNGVSSASRSAPEEARKHYEGTFKAMNRMRAAIGRPPLPTAIYDPEQPPSAT
jgi:class 3 adenylate cyclase